jgi:hypothetical protein
MNETKLVTDLMGQTSVVAAQSSLVASHTTKSTEKDEIGTVKSMKTIDNEGILLFLSKYIPDSVQSAAYQVPKDLRVPLGKVLKVPVDKTLVNYYKDSVGKGQRFIKDLRNHILSDRDFDFVSLTNNHAMSKSNEFSMTNLYDMLAKCEQKLAVLGGDLGVENNLQIKRAILKNIGPQVLHDYTSRKYGDLIISEYCSTEKMISYVEKGINSYSSFTKQQKDINPQTAGGKVGINATTTTDDDEKVADNKKKEEKNCWRR